MHPLHSALLLAGLGAGARATFTGPIEHVVLLMLENRAFDHMCGFCRLCTVFAAALALARVLRSDQCSRYEAYNNYNYMDMY